MIPVISGTVAAQTVDGGNTINPFTSVSIIDPNDFVSDVTLTITSLDANGNPTDANGTLSIPAADLGNDTFTETSPGVYVLTNGSAPGPSSTVPFFQSQLAAMTFIPTDAATTTFKLAELDGYGERQTDTQTTVTASGATTHSTAPSDTPTDTSNAAPFDTPTDTSNAAPSDTPTDTSNAAPFDTPTDTSNAAPSDTPTDTSNAAPSDTPTDTSNAAPSGTPTDTSNAAPFDTPTDTSNAAPSDTPTDTSNAAPFDTPTDTSNAAPSDTPTDTSNAAPSGTPTDTSSTTSTNATTVTGYVGSKVTETLTSGSQLVINHPNRFHGQVDLGSGDIDLNGLARADSYSFRNDMLTIYASNGKAIDKLRLTTNSSAFSVEKTATGVSIYTADDILHSSTGTLLPLHC